MYAQAVGLLDLCAWMMRGNRGIEAGYMLCDVKHVPAHICHNDGVDGLDGAVVVIEDVFLSRVSKHGV